MGKVIRLFKMAKPWAHLLVLATFATLAVVGINLYAPYVTRRVVAIIEQGGGASGEAIRLPLLLLLCFAVRAAGQFVSSYYGHVASWRLVSRVRCVLYAHFQKLSMRFYHDKQTGQLMSNVIADTATFEEMIAHALPELISNVIILVGVFTILMTINPTLALLACAPLPFLAGLTVILRKLRANFRKGQAKVAELNAILQDNFSGMKEIQVFNKQEHELGRVKIKTDEHADALLTALLYSNLLHPLAAFIASAGTVIVLLAGPFMAARAALTVADVVAFLLYLNLFYAPISTISRTIEDIQRALAGADRVFEILDTEPDVADAPGAKAVGRLSGDVAFERVSFAYNDGADVLNDVSFHVPPGGMMALVGPTGVGKTTISALIARFYDPTGGRVTMDGVDVKDMTMESLRNQLSLVLQDVFLFNGTVAENIAYGCESATRESVVRAAKATCIHDYITTMPDGYDTVIGERGVRLSGGQKQRIAIARAVLRDSPILVLDEATSAVDTETETEIQRAIDGLAGTRTLVVIAHRLSTVRRADVIIVLDDGKIAEQGTHEELLAQGGMYAKLYNRQSA